VLFASSDIVKCATTISLCVFAGISVQLMRININAMRKTKHSLTELRLTYRRKKVKDDLLSRKITSPRQVYQLFKDMQDETKEKLVCLHLSHQKEILSYEVVAIGTAHSIVVDAAGIFRAAILTGAASIIVVHNHPLGTRAMSPEDKQTIVRLTESGKILGIPLLDFIVIGEDGYTSFDDLGQIAGHPPKKRQ
jgi:DNA repair protein RadC